MYEQNQLSWRTSFTKNKQNLISLMNEINEDEFDNIGTILLDAPIEELRGISHENYSMRNIILYFCAPNSWVGFHFTNFIGLFEVGNSQIGVFVSKDKSRYWISNISEIVYTLKKVMYYWNTAANYNKRELEIANEEWQRIQEEHAWADAQRQMEEDAKSFWADMRDWGYSDDDF